MRIKVESYVEENSKISGVTHTDPQSGKPRQQLIKDYLRPGTRLEPILEPDNAYDPNAIGLWITVKKFLSEKRYHIGYINKIRAEHLAAKMRSGMKVNVIVTEITGGTRDKPTRGVNIAIRY
jgi:DNA-dependent RNA polymerase auxiliary subunit epsilon